MTTANSVLTDLNAPRDPKTGVETTVTRPWDRGTPRAQRSSTVSHPGPTTSLPIYWVGRLWQKVFGWECEGEPPQVPKAIGIAYPHTTNWDLPHMLAAAYTYRYRISWLGKHSLFKFPFGWFMRLLGGVAVERSKSHGLVKSVADLFEKHDRLFIVVPAEGTRGKRDFWKSGFYHMACEAKVPIVCGYLDYKRKKAGLGYTFMPTGDVKADMDKIREFYEGINGKFPEEHSQIRLKEEQRNQK